MAMRAAALSLLLVGCGPVMLGEDIRTHDGGNANVVDRDSVEAAVPAVDTAGDDRDAAFATASPRPSVSVSVNVKAIDCGRCFELQAEGSGGRPPYEFAWEDGSRRATRRVCVENAALSLSVIASDAAAARSAPQVIRLEGLSAAACPGPMPPPAATPPALICLENPSFEGTPVANLGQPDAFDAPPWITCAGASSSNTPDIINENETLSQTYAMLPKPTDGLTFLSLGEGEQVSQPFCTTVEAGAALSLQLDLARVEVQGVTSTAAQVFLEIWGGLAVDCSQRELLWASPALKTGWKPYCVTLHPHSFMNQITLRANSDMTLPAYLIVDNLKPMDKCP
jgi:hypothetical protein